MAEQPSEREALSEVELIERAALLVGMKSLLNHGAASCVYSEGCAGVSQDHLVAFAREVALHCVAALSQPSTEQGWTHEINQELDRQYLKGFQAGKAFEREECAKAAEAEQVEDTGHDGDVGYNLAIKHCATAIRSRKDAP